MDEQIFIESENYYEPWDRWFENRIYPSPDGVSIFFHEITERKHAEQAARDNAALLLGPHQGPARGARGRRRVPPARRLRGHARGLGLIAGREPLEHTLDALLRLIEAQCPGM